MAHIAFATDPITFSKNGDQIAGGAPRSHLPRPFARDAGAPPESRWARRAGEAAGAPRAYPSTRFRERCRRSARVHRRPSSSPSDPPLGSRDVGMNFGDAALVLRHATEQPHEAAGRSGRLGIGVVRLSPL